MSNVLGTLFGDIAAAIRSKNADAGTMKPAEFPEKIAAIEGQKDPKLLVASGVVSPTTTDSITITHGLGVLPDVVMVFLAALEDGSTLSPSDATFGGEVAYSEEAIADGAQRYIYNIMGSNLQISADIYSQDDTWDDVGCVRKATTRTFVWSGSTSWPVKVGARYHWVAIGGIKTHPRYLDVSLELDGLGNLIVHGGVPEISQLQIYVDGTLGKTVDYVHGDSFTVDISDVTPEVKQYTISVKVIGEGLDAAYKYQFFEPVTGWVLPKARGTCGDNVNWAVDGDGVMTISGTGPMTDYNFIQLPPWDSYKSEISSLVVKPGVTSVGAYVCNTYTKLQSVTLADSVTTIGNSAFLGCAALVTFDMGNGVVSIGSNALQKCTGLQKLVLSSSLTTWGTTPVYGCTGLKSLVIPDGVTKIGSRAFEGCTALSSVAFGNTVTEIGDSAFKQTAITDIVIPDSVVKISNAAFNRIATLTTVTIGSGVTSIGSNAFYGCGLTTATFKVTDGWWVSTSSTATSGTAVAVIDPSRAADFLKNTHVGKYWYRS